jgi:hypothetical protein
LYCFKSLPVNKADAELDSAEQTESIISANAHIPQKKQQKSEQNRQSIYVYNITLKRVLATTVVVEKQYVLHILSVCL